ncbi:hypothetical protein [Ralstonia solanacearum]|uniref:hypothetical protein n=1 Tax=Ralstonia solanacearum TaxID=305 RepID=UPI001FFCFD99|nr:hypothetical protein [Ralstonia solanacearum]
MTKARAARHAPCWMGVCAKLAAHLNVRPTGLDTAETRDVAMVFKALASTGLKDGLRLLATQGLQRLQTLQAGTQFRSDNLETLGSLAAGLLPLVRARPNSRHSAPRRSGCWSGCRPTWRARCISMPYIEPPGIPAAPRGSHPGGTRRSAPGAPA